MDECSSFTDVLKHGMCSKTCEYTVCQGSSTDCVTGPDAIESATCLVRLRYENCMKANFPISVVEQFVLA